jgi:hypothetical protein
LHPSGGHVCDGLLTLPFEILVLPAGLALAALELAPIGSVPRCTTDTDARSFGKFSKLPNEKEHARARTPTIHQLEPIWEQFIALLPERKSDHPLGCHRPRVPDGVLFEKLVQVLVFGCAYCGG